MWSPPRPVRGDPTPSPPPGRPARGGLPSHAPSDPGSPPVAPPGGGWRWFEIVLALCALIAVLVWVGAVTASDGGIDDVEYSTFLEAVRADRVAAVLVDTSSGELTGSYVSGRGFAVQGPASGLAEADVRLLDAHGVERAYVAPSGTSGVWGWLPGLVLPLAALGGIVWWLSRRAARTPPHHAAPASTTAGKVYDAAAASTTLADVAGYDAVKEEIHEVVDFLRDPARFEAIGARVPKGVLLVGPPGTGKTLLARAVAGEAGVPFISAAGSDFMEMYVGVGAARVRSLFERARTHPPSIVFVDEIDSIGRRRGANASLSHEERDQTLNQLLAEMDGFETTAGIVVMAATNRPDILDPALLRAGRFDRQIVIPLPTLDERVAILQVHTLRTRLADDVDVELVARGTPGMSGADLANLVNEAALLAVRRAATEIHARDLDAARDRVLMGVKRTSLVLDEHEQDVVAHHEAGHAVLACLLEHADPVHKVTILPTGMALGATQQLPTAERHLHSRQHLLDTIAVQLAGRTAEELAFGDVSTGAANDLREATRLAERMVREWGMSERLGPRTWDGDAGFLGDDGRVGRVTSDAAARSIDEEVDRILAGEDARAHELLAAHLAALHAVAAALVRAETIDGDEVVRIVARGGLRPVPTPAEHLVPEHLDHAGTAPR